ncbi:TetR family transcriptional regulator [Nonomuraea sp. NPDC050540]|uniref:TetR family transcriptional regulator n=1 Tax=Nonomuraea sp. NPDC050540 TaxID=3364367 RepID=UPI003792E406
MIDTRDRILAAARELFARQGSQNTSVREIAEELGLTKTAILYHFRTKADILATLAQPLIDDTDAAVERVAREGGGGWGTVETLLEVYLRHRDVLSTVVANMPALPPEVFERWFTVMNRANEMVAGPSPDLGGRVRAIQVVALLSDPVILLADVPTDELRHHILNGARRLLTEPPEPPERPAQAAPPGTTSPSAGRRPATGDERPTGSEGAWAEEGELSVGAGALAEGERSSAEGERPFAGGRRRAAGGEGALAGGGGSGAGGRPRSMSEEMVAEARRLRQNGDTPMSEIARILGVSRATLYRHL